MFDLLRRKWFALYFDKDDGGSGGTTDNGTGDDPDKKKSGEDPNAGDDPDKSKAKKEEKLFTQAELEAQIKDRLERERKKSDAAAEKARKEAEAAALEKNQEWQKLAESRATEVETLTKEKTELESFKEQAEKYRKALEGQLTKAKEKLPKHILQLLDKMDPVDAMSYITENADALGAKPETYSETPEGKEKKLSDEDKKEAQKASSSVITRVF